MAEFVKRAHFFDNQFVRADDFNLEQGYQVAMRRRHNRDLHTWGVVPGGLEIQFRSNAEAITVSPGMAMTGWSGTLKLMSRMRATVVIARPAATMLSLASQSRTT